MVTRVEPILVAFFLATWIVVLLAVLGVVDLRGRLDLALYPLYSTAAAAGWLAGIVYVRSLIWMVSVAGLGWIGLVAARAA